MYELKICVDDREQKIIPFFKEYKPFTLNHNISYKVMRLTTSDYAIMYGDKILVLIERKSWSDLSASLKDGRHKNVDKLLNIRKKTNCCVLYLIEGPPIPNTKTKFGGISYKCLRARLDHLMFRDNIHVIHTKNKKQTVSRIYEITKNYLTIKPSMLLPPSKKTDVKGGVDLLQQKITKSVECITYKIWECIPYITEKTASLFVNKNYYIHDLILGNIPKEIIYSFRYDNGYIVGKRSEKIWKKSRLNGNNKVFSNMLQCINGITKKTANKILDTISFEELLKGNITQKVICDIKKSETRKIGQKVSGLIIQYFTPLKKMN
jgi:ERCC4-type nuclease